MITAVYSELGICKIFLVFTQETRVIHKIIYHDATQYAHLGDVFSAKVEFCNKNASNSILDIGHNQKVFVKRLLSPGETCLVEIVKEARGEKHPVGVVIPPEGESEFFRRADGEFTEDRIKESSIGLVRKSDFSFYKQLVAVIRAYRPTKILYDDKRFKLELFEHLSEEERDGMVLRYTRNDSITESGFRFSDLTAKRVDRGIGLVIEETEACTFIDVNSSSLTLPHLQLNILAADLILEEAEKRGISGVVLIDFIGMKRRDESALLAHMRKTGYRHSAGWKIHGFTQLGMVELTRERKKASVYEFLESRTDLLRLIAAMREKTMECIARFGDRPELKVTLQPELYEKYRKDASVIEEAIRRDIPPELLHRCPSFEVGKKSFHPDFRFDSKKGEKEATQGEDSSSEQGEAVTSC